MTKLIKFKKDNDTTLLPSSSVSIAGGGDVLSNLVEYSTQEKVIGKWIDGKPIYRKGWSGLFGDGYILLSNIDKIIDIGGMGMMSGVWRTLPYTEEYNGRSYRLVVNKNTANTVVLVIMDNGEHMTSVNVTMWVEYTKL